MVPGGPGFVAAVVAAQVLTQIGAFTLPALLPGYIERWALSNTEAGLIGGIFRNRPRVGITVGGRH